MQRSTNILIGGLATALCLGLSMSVPAVAEGGGDGGSPAINTGQDIVRRATTAGRAAVTAVERDAERQYVRDPAGRRLRVQSGPRPQTEAGPDRRDWWFGTEPTSRGVEAQRANRQRRLEEQGFDPVEQHRRTVREERRRAAAERARQAQERRTALERDRAQRRAEAERARQRQAALDRQTRQVARDERQRTGERTQREGEQLRQNMWGRTPAR